jgi:hypothetical protein
MNLATCPGVCRNIGATRKENCEQELCELGIYEQERRREQELLV